MALLQVITTSFNITVIITIALFIDLIGATTSEERLFQSLFSNDSYNKLQRPVNLSVPAPVHVDITLAVYALQSIDEKMQMLTINAWVKLEWRDYRLVWDPATHNDMTRISVPITDIWTPQIVLENQAVGRIDVPVVDEFSLALVNSEGIIRHEAPEKISSLCSIDISNFPFDKQNCEVRFSSPVETTDLVMLKPISDLRYYRYDETQWKLINVTGTHLVFRDHYPLSGEMSYSDAIFKLLVQRLPSYHLKMSALPSTILTLLAFTVFLLPTDCNEKIALGVSLLIGLSMFQLLVNEVLPATGLKQPLLGTYLTMNFVVVGLISFCAAVSKTVYYQRGPVKSDALRKAFLEILPAVFLVRTPGNLGLDRNDTHVSMALESHNEWRQERRIIAVVLDRLFFTLTASVYLFTTIILSLRILYIL